MEMTRERKNKTGFVENQWTKSVPRRQFPDSMNREENGRMV